MEIPEDERRPVPRDKWKVQPGPQPDGQFVVGEPFCARRSQRVLLRCACGRERVVAVSDYLRGKSLGCKQCGSVSVGNKNRRHGMFGTREYATWVAIIQRCTNPNLQTWDNYGGRGIRVCDRWLNSFEAFFEDMGPRPSAAHSIERVDNNLGYSPENCKWATPDEQGKNRRCNVFLTFRGETLCLEDWARRLGISSTALRYRLGRWKWPLEKALTTPRTR